MKISDFGKKFTGDAGILSLMDDLGNAMASGDKNLIMMGGGNPGEVKPFQEAMRLHLNEITNDPKKFSKLVGAYDPPEGNKAFLKAVAKLLRNEYGWDLTEKNICLTNGSQSGFFLLFNLFAGKSEGGVLKKIHLPLAPEYIGYADLGMCDDFFVSTKPKIELLDDLFFKYRIDFKNLNIDSNTGAICVSRPTNPTGNVITDEEVEGLDRLAKEHNIPLILDNAYGVPFPGIIYTEATPQWNENIIKCLSLSKLGLPAVRTGIIVANEEVIRAVTSMNAIMALSPGTFGAVLCHDLVESGKIIETGRDVIRPFYKKKVAAAVEIIKKEFVDIPCRVHKPEGAMFLWLWFENLPISSLELYNRLKKRGVLVISGHYFFPGLDEDWPHKNECIRITYSQDDEQVKKGLAIIAEEVKKAFATT